MRKSNPFLIILSLTFCYIGMSSFAANDGNSLLVSSENNEVIANTLTAAESTDDRLKIRLQLTTTTNFNREILLTIDNNATDGYDKGYDAKYYDNHPNDMYWVLEDIGLVIQSINKLALEKVLPLGFRSDGACSMTVKVKKVENSYPELEVYLRDNATMDTYDILNGEFEISLKEGLFNEAYSLVFKPKEEETELEMLVPLEEITAEQEIAPFVDTPLEPYNKLAVFVSSQSQTLNIRKPEKLIVSDIAMYNILGQQVGLWSDVVESSETDIPLEFKTGIYYLNMYTNEGTVQRKILIK